MPIAMAQLTGSEGGGGDEWSRSVERGGANGFNTVAVDTLQNEWHHWAAARDADFRIRTIRRSSACRGSAFLSWFRARDNPSRS